MAKSKCKVRAGSRILLPIALCVAAAPAAISQVATAPASQRADAPPPGAYAGDKACAQCHRKEAEPYARTAHARDSGPADAQHVVGSFSPDHDLMRTSDPNLVVGMIAKPSGFYQGGINISDPDHPTGEEERLDIAIGSGRHGQSYLYWKGDELYELPASWWTWNQEWVMSPGFRPGQIHFDRPIVPRCLECHASYFTWMNPPPNRYARDSLVLGIDCERCHGPGALHVSRERSPRPPARGSADEAIVNPARLSRDRQLDLCSLCHAGAVEPLGSSMRFLPGDNVRNFLKIPPLSPDAPVDVHGNQVGALEQSRCFTSGKMTCSTCHDVHQVQENADAFSRHCLTCHQVQSCGRFKVLGTAIRTRCVDCHMPLQDSAKITPVAGEQILHALLRAHRIAIYPEAAAQVEQQMRGK